MRSLKQSSNQIVMLLPTSFNKTPRIQRECEILSKNNHHIHIIDAVGTKSEAKNIEGGNNIIFHHVLVPKLHVSEYATTGDVLKTLLRYTIFSSRAFILLMKLRKNRISCVHCCHIYSLLLGGIFKRIMKCRVIYDAYEFYYLYFERHAPRILVPILRKVEEKLSHKADMVITWWKTIAEFLKKRYGLQNVILFPNLPPPDFFVDANPPSENRKEFGLSPDDFVIFYGGRLAERPYKLNELLDACALLITSYTLKNVKLLFAGSGPLLADLEDRSKKLKIKEHCIFLGYVPYREISSLYHVSDVVYAMSEPICDHLMLPSGKIFEAMYSKKPIITCHLGEKMRLVEEAKSGLTVKPEVEEIAKALLKLIRNEGLRKKMGENGYSYFRKFLSWDKYEKMFSSAYENLLHGHS